MKTYEIDIINIFIKALLVSVILNILFLVSSKSYDLTSFVIATFIIIIVEFSISFMSKKLTKIVIGENNIKLYFRKLIIVKKIDVIVFEDFQFSFKEEFGAKGVKIEQLRLYYKNEKIIGLGKGFDGWKDKVICNIIEDFRLRDIKEIK